MCYINRHSDIDVNSVERSVSSAHTHSLKPDTCITCTRKLQRFIGHNWIRAELATSRCTIRHMKQSFLAVFFTLCNVSELKMVNCQQSQHRDCEISKKYSVVLCKSFQIWILEIVEPFLKIQIEHFSNFVTKNNWKWENVHCACCTWEIKKTSSVQQFNIIFGHNLYMWFTNNAYVMKLNNCIQACENYKFMHKS